MNNISTNDLMNKFLNKLNKYSVMDEEIYIEFFLCLDKEQQLYYIKKLDHEDFIIEEDYYFKMLKDTIELNRIYKDYTN